MWYKTGYSSTSKEITVDLPERHYCFDPTKSYHLWYAEDEHNHLEGNNHGTAETDVLIQIACECQSLSTMGFKCAIWGY